MAPRWFYLIAALIGTIVPWWFFSGYFAEHGLRLSDLPGSLFPNGAAGGFVADVLLSIVVFLFWSWRDARRLGIGRWWLVVPATFCVGLSLALPLYLFLRDGMKESPETA